MKYTTLSDNPVTADFSDDGVFMSCTYIMYNSDLKKVVITDKMLLTHDELEQIYNAYKKFKGETK
jgi:hypothetical protein